MAVLKRYLNGLNVISLTEEINQMLGGGEDDEKVYPNQIQCAINAIKAFDEDYPRPNHIIVKGKTQSGKTGVLTGIIMLISNKLKIKEQLGVKTIYYITGDNSTGLIKQTKKRLDSCVKDGTLITYKNSDLNKDLYEKGTRIKNAIIFIDESHYGSNKVSQVLPKWLKHHGLNMKNESSLVEKNVYVISNSATPYVEMESDGAKCKSVVYLDTDNWDEKSKKGYVGFEQYFNNSNIISVNKDEKLTTNNIEDWCKKIKILLEEIKDLSGKSKCAILRTATKIYNSSTEEIFEKYFNCEQFSCKNGNINYREIEAVLKKPNRSKPVLVIITGAYRMGVSIDNDAKTNIGVVYDVANSGINSVVTTEQGLLGRVSGYWNNDEWKYIKIFINNSHIIPLESCYVTGEYKTPLTKTKSVFVEDENGKEIGIVNDEEVTREYDAEFEYGGDNGEEYNEEIQTWLRNKDNFYSNLVAIPGRRRDSKKAVFSLHQHGVSKLLTNDNIGKRCYTFTYNPISEKIYVSFGTIAKGKTIEKNFSSIKPNEVTRTDTVIV